jgi:hypothetical protein
VAHGGRVVQLAGALHALDLDRADEHADRAGAFDGR